MSKVKTCYSLLISSSLTPEVLSPFEDVDLTSEQNDFYSLFFHLFSFEYNVLDFIKLYRKWKCVLFHITEKTRKSKQ
jgi:hypothetical protein